MFSARLDSTMGLSGPSLAGPRRPEDRVPLRGMRGAWRQALREFVKDQTVHATTVADWVAEGGQPGPTAATTFRPRDLGELSRTVPVEMAGERGELAHGAVVIAAITSCTNTSNP